jgi:uncharacterized protein HemX
MQLSPQNSTRRNFDTSTRQPVNTNHRLLTAAAKGRSAAGRNSGFTVLESLFIALILTLGAIMTFSLQIQFRDRQQLTSAVELIASHTRDAQNNSVLAKQGHLYGVQFHDHAISLLQYATGQAVPDQRRLDQPTKITIEPQLKTNDNQAPTTVVRFEKLTGKPDATGTIVVSSGRHQATITITTSSQIHNTEPTKI